VCTMVPPAAQETLGYLKAAEAHLAPGALVIADNAVVFAQVGWHPDLHHLMHNRRCQPSSVRRTKSFHRSSVTDIIQLCLRPWVSAGRHEALQRVCAV
jgi:predicted O-methyltransferase YrrM